MLDIKDIIKNENKMQENLKVRNIKLDLKGLIAQYHNYIDSKKSIEQLQMQANAIAHNIKVDKLNTDKEKLVIQGKYIKEQLAALKEKHICISENFQKELLKIPNWMSCDVPIGNADNDNVEIRKFREPRKFAFPPKDHIELGKNLDLIDFEAGAKVAGTKFYFLKNELVLLQHAIKAFVFRKVIQKGFTCLQTPDLARNSILQGIGFGPRGEGSNTYIIEGEDLSLIATAEITVGGMHANEIIDLNKLPLLYVAESHCFRRESGAAGQLGKGMYRVHQFEKIELFAFCTPDQSEHIHQMIVALEEEIYQELGIPYRVVLNCSGDLGAPAYKKYDIEAWMPGKGQNGEYGEITSASNCTDYQARRLGIRYRNPKTGELEFVHTLNGTAVALSRTPIAIMENYQTEGGGIKIPEVLIPYLGFDYIKPKT